MTTDVSPCYILITVTAEDARPPGECGVLPSLPAENDL